MPVMRLVIGGVASRYALPVDSLDDIELAVETLVREEPPGGGEVTLSLWVEDGAFRVGLAGLTSALVRNALSSGEELRGDVLGEESILRMIVDALLDGYRMAEDATAGSFAVEMEKRIP